MHKTNPRTKVQSFFFNIGIWIGAVRTFMGKGHIEKKIQLPFTCKKNSGSWTHVKQYKMCPMNFHIANDKEKCVCMFLRASVCLFFRR